MVHIETIDIQFLEAVVLHQEQSDVMACKLVGGKPDFLFETNQRTEFLFHLISLFEVFKFEKFKIYVSKNISIKHFFELEKLSLGTFEDTLSIEELQEKKAILMKKFQEKLR